MAEMIRAKTGHGHSDLQAHLQHCVCIQHLLQFLPRCIELLPHLGHALHVGADSLETLGMRISRCELHSTHETTATACSMAAPRVRRASHEARPLSVLVPDTRVKAFEGFLH